MTISCHKTIIFSSDPAQGATPLGADGSRFEPKTRLHFDQGSWTRRIDLPGHRRRILKVEFWYRSKVARNGKARVQLIGLR